VVGGWDVRPEAATTRHSRHSTRDEAVAAARQLGDVVVHGMRGEVLATFPSQAEDVEPAPPIGGAPAAGAAAGATGAGSASPGRPSSTATARRPGLRLSQLLALTDQTDVSGRLLLEDSAPKQAVRNAERTGVSMRTESCPYQDTPSRFGGLMNAGAYEALRHDTAEILNGFAWLSNRHLAAEPGDVGAPRRLYATSYLGVTLAHVLFHRAEDPVPPHRSLPTYVASIFKASRGIFSFSIQLLNDLDPGSEMTAAEVLQYAEENRQLVRPSTGRVCAAPTRLIERTLDAILTGHGADADRSGLAELVDFSMLWEVYKLQDALGKAISTYRAVYEGVTAPFGPAADPNRIFSAKIPTGLAFGHAAGFASGHAAGPGGGQTFGQFTEQLLVLVNDIQGQINAVLGRAGNARPVGLQEVFELL
jgi:hypothetical protein